MCSLLLRDSRVKNKLLDQGRVSAFILACVSGSREGCELFLKNGADITSKLVTGQNALHVVSFLGYGDVCELVIETGSSFFLCKRAFYGMRFE